MIDMVVNCRLFSQLYIVRNDQTSVLIFCSQSLVYVIV